jgi:hypothetical protein
MTILQDLFYGNIAPHAGRFDSHSEYGKAMQVIADNEAKLLILLKDTEKNLFVGFRDAQSELNAITAEEKFIQGFRLGALMMLDIAGGWREA